MSHEIDSPPGLRPAALPSWAQIWWNAVTRPTVTTYAGFASDPRASRSTAYRWVVWPALFAGLGLAFTQVGSNLGGKCLGPILAALFGLLFFAFTAGLSQFLARALGGTGTFDELAFATAAYYTPVALIGSVLSVIPNVELLNIPLWAYQLILNAVAVKAVHGISWGRAAVPSAVLAALGVCVGIGLTIVSVAWELQQGGV